MKKMEILKKQEEMLQFPHFDQEEGCKLGVFMTEYARKHVVTIVIRIFIVKNLQKIFLCNK